MATEFKITVKPSTQGGDYTTLESAVNANECNLTTSKVIAGSLTRGAIADGVAITQTTSGATAVCKHHTSTQLLINTIAGGAINNSNTWYPTADGNDTTNAWTPTDVGDSVQLSVEIDGDWSGGADTTAVTIHNYITSQGTCYLNIYTATAARHKGVYSTNYYVLNNQITVGNFDDNTGDCRIDGLQILCNWADDWKHAINCNGYHQNLKFYISNCLIKSTGNNNTFGIYVQDANNQNVSTFCWNNIIYGFNNATQNFAINACRGGFRAFNNTIYGNNVGIFIATTVAQAYLKNNICNGNTTDYSDTGSKIYATSTHNLSEDTTAPLAAVADSGTCDGDTANHLIDSDQNFLTTVKVGMRVKNTDATTYANVTAVNSDSDLTLSSDLCPNGNENYTIYAAYVSAAVTFVNETAGSEDFHLGSTDTAAIGKGANLYADTPAITTDIDGEARPNDTTFDIGADEYVSAGTNASITQVSATLTLSVGTQAVATTRLVSISQTAKVLTLAAGTQSIAAVRIVAISQVSKTLTLGVGTQSVGSLVNISISQVAATITLGVGTQVISAVRNVAITQVAKALDLVAGTQVIGTVRIVSISQTAKALTLTGGIQTISVLTGRTGWKFDSVNGWYSYVVKGTEVARLKENGDLDLKGIVNINAF